VNSGAPKVWHPWCYSCYKPDDKSWMRKWPDCDYDKQNVSVVICYSVMVNWVMTSTYRNLGAVASLLVATIYCENHGRSHKLWNIVSTTSIDRSELANNYITKVVISGIDSSTTPNIFTVFQSLLIAYVCMQQRTLFSQIQISTMSFINNMTPVRR
jgi:hypothetical protein